MSLTAYVFVVDNGEHRILNTPACCEDLAGFESWRRTMWGSPAVRALGARVRSRPVVPWAPEVASAPGGR